MSALDTPRSARRAESPSTSLPTRQSGRRGRLVLAGLAAAVISVAGLGAPSPTTAVDRASFKLNTSYVLKSSLNYSTGTISTAETIDVTNVSGDVITKINLSVMPRAFGELTSIGSFLVDGRGVTARWTNNANLELQLGRVVYHGQSTRISLKFTVRASGVIGTSLEGRLSKANGIMQVSHWFPIASDGHAARYPGDSQYTRTAGRIRLELTTESSSVRIAAPGRVVSSSGRYHVYELTNARDFAFGASPTYKVASGSSAGATVSVYYTTGNGAAALTNAKAALARYESLFGQYQWSRYVVAQTGRAYSGNEYPGIVFIGGPILGSRAVVVHETAHQWWYAMAGNDQNREPWLDEGIAEFAANYAYGGFHSYSSTRPVNSTIYEFPNEPAASSSHPYVQTVYYKSSAFLNGLRTRMGNTNFFNGLRRLFESNRNGVMTTREFYDTMAAFGAPTTYMRSFIRL